MTNSPRKVDVLISISTEQGTIYKHLTGCTLDTSSTEGNQERTGTLTMDIEQAGQLIDFLATGQAAIEKIEPTKGEEKE
nr:MAG TPA: hypothetical protein [Caudoviricetes sp.]